MSQTRLAILVFLSGASVMMLELCGSRVLAPQIGSSIFVWTSLIGAILAALSIGYWRGGLLADQSPSGAQLSIIFVVASAFVAIVALLNAPFVLLVSRLDIDPRLSALICATALFAPPSVALGMVPPYVIRLALGSLESAGRSIGLLTAFSTLGSIAGTFLLGFFLLAKIGTIQTLYLIAFVLLICAFIANVRFRAPAKIALIFALVGLRTVQGRLIENMEALGLHDLDTSYQRVIVYETKIDSGKTIRALVTGPEGAQSLMDIDHPDELAIEYLQLFRAGLLLTPDAHNALLIGGGGFSFPKFMAAQHPGIHLDVVELDPGMVEVARRFFHYSDKPNVSVHIGDARIFLNRLQANAAAKKFDIAFADAYNSAANIPFHLATREFFSALSSAITDDGTAVVNIIATVEGPKNCLYRHMYYELKQFFPEVRVYRAMPEWEKTRMQNIVLVGRRGKRAGLDPLTAEQKSELRLGQRLHETAVPGISEPFTDNFAPAEHAAAFGC